jgi:geranylgeranyl pyrophosphate synthase
MVGNAVTVVDPAADTEAHGFAEFRHTLADALTVEYEQILGRFGLQDYAPSLYSGRYFRSRLAHQVAGEDSQTLLDRCKALEMLHTATLVHDDVIDKAVLRRNLPTIAHLQGPDEALLIGNMIATRAITIVASAGEPMTTDFLDAYDRVNTAQERELRYRGFLDKTEEQYYQICRGKTSAMLELAFLIGAAENGPDHGHEHLLLAIREVGIAFQVIDDVEDLVAWLEGAEIDRSKRAQFDIELGNYTLPVIVALAAASGDKPERSLAEVDKQTWLDAIETTFKVAFRHLETAEAEVDRARKKAETPLVVQRVDAWSKRVSEALHTKKLDSVVRDFMHDGENDD